MIEKGKIKVAWVCSVSNSMLRNQLDLGFPVWFRAMRKIVGKGPMEKVADYAQWNSNAIEEFEKIDKVELHVIFAHKQMRKRVQRFMEKNIHYYAVREDDYGIIGYLRTRIFGDQWLFNRSNKTIARLVDEIHPDIIHVQGAEMLAHSPSVLLFPRTIPILVQLETMLQAPESKKYSPNLSRQRNCEFKVIERADYLGYKGSRFKKIVRENVKADAVFVNTQILIGEKGNLTPCAKEFDFVYFANYINKSIDLAIEAFAIAHHHRPELTLDVIGSVTDADKESLSSYLERLDCKDAVTFEGKLETHNDVLIQIRKAKFALLPLKSDTVSGTIREAMWNGLPVITTITAGTPLLNKKRESLLISEIGDNTAMAENMLRLIEDFGLAERLRTNASITVEEFYGNNTLRARDWVAAYYACIDNFKNGMPFPDNILNKN